MTIHGWETSPSKPLPPQCAARTLEIERCTARCSRAASQSSWTSVASKMGVNMPPMRIASRDAFESSVVPSSSGCDGAGALMSWMTARAGNLSSVG
jgi:hypothetical protein